jgi:PRC-barrel domain
MKRLILSLILAGAASGFAYAQEPAAQPDPNTPHPPENRMDAATPTMKAPEGTEQTAPTNRVGEAVPPMKATDSAKSGDTAASPSAAPENAATTGTDTATKSSAAPKFTVTEAAAKDWIGRPVYSSDNKRLGEIAALQRGPDDAVSELRADIGGFLGFGETRVRFTADQIKEVKGDSLVVTLTEAEAKSLPAVDKD